MPTPEKVKQVFEILEKCAQDEEGKCDDNCPLLQESKVTLDMSGAFTTDNEADEPLTFITFGFQACQMMNNIIRNLNLDPIFPILKMPWDES